LRVPSSYAILYYYLVGAQELNAYPWVVREQNANTTLIELLDGCLESWYTTRHVPERFISVVQAPPIATVPYQIKLVAVIL
jgi:hypothetical protein